MNFKGTELGETIGKTGDRGGVESRLALNLLYS